MEKLFGLPPIKNERNSSEKLLEPLSSVCYSKIYKYNKLSPNKNNTYINNLNSL